jgi:PD-(D/E)XK nuclease superfamily
VDSEAAQVAAFCAPYVAGIDANRTLKDELAAAIGRRAARRRISVTDLLNPRQAYFARTRPELKPSPDRQQFMLAGTGFHELFGRAISTEEFVEQLVEFQEIVGKIDVYEAIPLELKTTTSIPTDVIASRPGHVEQLGMYCTMVGRGTENTGTGHLLYYKRAEWGRPPELKAFDVEFSDLAGMAEEMVRRRDLLREALEAQEPARLPRCEWFGRSCTYAEVCGCAAAAPLRRIVTGDNAAVRENLEFAQRVKESLVPLPSREGLTVNDLVFPRKAAYRRRAGGRQEEDTEEKMASLQHRGFQAALEDVIWYGIPGASRRVKSLFGQIKASIVLFQGLPMILRNNKQRKMIARDRLPEDVPHYLDRLGFECALVGSERGRLIIYYSAIPDDKFMVYDMWFKNLGAIRAEMERRLALLEGEAPPEDLPPCRPSWMARFCQFAPGCGCARG